MKELNNIEKAVLTWISDHSENSALRAQIASVKFENREWTKVGFHIDISVDRECPALDLSFPLYGPEIESSEIEHGACSLIWREDGYINGIELAAYGSYFGETITTFTLGAVERGQ